MHEFHHLEKLYEGNECENSLFYLKQGNPFRKFLYKIVKSDKFDMFITVVLLFSTLQQIVDTYFQDDVGYSFVSDQVDFAISLIYTIEMCMKVAALGFVMNRGTYLTDNWNKLDFFVMIVTIIDIGNKITVLATNQKLNSLAFFNILKLLRTLRIFRIVSKSENMRNIISSLLDALTSIFKILGILFIVFIMMSIIGINLFYDLYDTCYILGDSEPQPILDFKDYLIKENILWNDTYAVNQYVNYIIYITY